MIMKRNLIWVLLASFLTFTLLFAGCSSETPQPTVTVTVTATPTPTPTPTPAPVPEPKPASVSVSPVESVNSLKTQHTFVATVQEADGSASKGAEVQWILNRFPDAVGDIVGASSENKADNFYATSLTDADGKAQLTITATRAGDTDLTVFVPGITDPAKHKVFAVKHWVDMVVDWPKDAVNKIGTDHDLSVKIYKVTDGLPLTGVKVNWTITDDTPDLQFKGYSATLNSVTTPTDANGVAGVTLQQVAAAAGENTVRIDVLSADSKVLFSQSVVKKWLSPSLNILKEGPGSVDLDLGVEYNITVRNDGDEGASDVKVVDNIPEGLTFVSSAPSGTVSGTTVTWSLATLAAKSSSIINVKFTAAKVGDWVNTAKATSAEGLTAEASAPLKVTAQAALQITKVGPETVTKGQNAEYTITVKNTGKIAATGTEVTDTIPAGLTYVSSTPSATVSGSTAKWIIGSLAPGATNTYKITFTADTVGALVNQVEVAANDTTKAQASFTTQVIPAKVAKVAVTKSGPPSIYLDKTGQFTITVNNTGEVPLTNVEVKDTLPANLSYLSSNPAGTATGQTITWTFASLTMGASETITIQAKSTSLGSFENSVSVTTTEGASATAQATGQVTSETGVTMQLIDTTDPVAVGGQITYEVAVTNQGIVAIHNLNVQFQLPNQVSFVSANGPTTYTTVGQTVTFASLATLDAGATMNFTVTVVASSAGDVICSVTSSYTEFTAPVTDQEGTTIYAP